MNVWGNKKEKIGIGLKKGLDYQDAVNKATRTAKNNILNVEINEEGMKKYAVKDVPFFE